MTNRSLGGDVPANWRDRLGERFVTAAEAVSGIKSGDAITVAPFTGTPFSLCQALFDRGTDVRNIRVDHPSCRFDWVGGDADRRFSLHDSFATAFDREMLNAGLGEYMPIAVWKANELPPSFLQEPDTFMVALSPPDENGYCSFGSSLSFSRTYCQRSKTVLAEIHEDFIRTGGDNFIHISEIDKFCDADPAQPGLPIPVRTPEEIAVTEVVCALVANELVNDRDTLQIGAGTVSAPLAIALEGKTDLGVQSEMITGGMASLVEKGVITGRYKTMHKDKVIGSSFVVLPPEELAMVDRNPVFELYEFNYTDDIRMLVQHDNLVAINNALFVDLTGQVASESIGPKIWSGVGGQTAFMIAAQYSRGGRSVVVLPASHILRGERVTRIMPMLPEGTIVTVPRTLVDYVVTEYGVATLVGKTVRERVGELVAVAHPDFRAELRDAAARIYGLTA